jgi:hypothetical protein
VVEKVLVVFDAFAPFFVLFDGRVTKIVAVKDFDHYQMSV